MAARRSTERNNRHEVVTDALDQSGLAGGWRFQTGVTSGRFYVDIPENERKDRARRAYKLREKAQPPAAWTGRELVPDYLALRFDGKKAVLRTKLIDGGDGDLRVPKHVFKMPAGDVTLATGTVWGYRWYRLVRPPAAYALAALALGLFAAGVNVSLAIGKSLNPPPIVISNTWIAVWQAIAAASSCAVLAIVFWAGHIWEAEE